ERALKALLLFSRYRSITVSNIANDLNISLTSAYRLVYSLEKTDFISKNKDRSYSLSSLNIMRLYNMIEKDLSEVAKPILKELVHQVDESVYITVMNDDKHYIYIEKEDYPSSFF